MKTYTNGNWMVKLDGEIATLFLNGARWNESDGEAGFAGLCSEVDKQVARAEFLADLSSDHGVTFRDFPAYGGVIVSECGTVVVRDLPKNMF